MAIQTESRLTTAFVQLPLRTSQCVCECQRPSVSKQSESPLKAILKINKRQAHKSFRKSVSWRAEAHTPWSSRCQFINELFATATFLIKQRATLFKVICIVCVCKNMYLIIMHSIYTYNCRKNSSGAWSRRSGRCSERPVRRSTRTSPAPVEKDK